MNNQFRGCEPRRSRIGVVESWSMRRCGQRDGRLGLPRPNSSGEWSSPLVEQELSQFSEFTQRIWRRCEEITADRYVEISKFQLRLSQLKIRFDGVADDQCYRGEENIDPIIIKSRRQKERSAVAEIEIRLAELMQQADITENQAKLICERQRCRVAQRLAFYLMGCFKTHPDSKKIPTALPVLYSQGEEIYTAQHKSSTLKHSESTKSTRRNRNAKLLPNSKKK
jgi:hypothetical protein